MEIVFERNALYDEVWSTPLTTLAKKYGLSDNGVRKACKAMNIPLPKAGHWTKVDTGKAVTRVPLPPDADRATYISHPPDPRSTTDEDIADAVWLAERVQFERDPINQIHIQEHVSRWHPLIQETRAELGRQAQKAQRWASALATNQTESQRKAGQVLNRRDSAWSQFEQNGQVLDLAGNHLPLEVTLGTWERALHITQALLVAAAQRGIQVAHGDKRHSLEFRLGESVVELKLGERLKVTDRRIPEIPALQDLLPPKYFWVPTGVLRVTVSAGTSVSKLEDRENKPLENQLNDVMIKVYRKVNYDRRTRRESLARTRRFEEEYQLHLKREADRKEKLRLAAEETARRQHLIDEATAWHQAKLLKEYLQNLRNLVATGRFDLPSVAQSQWFEWADRVADDLDPTLKRLAHEVEQAQKGKSE